MLLSEVIGHFVASTSASQIPELVYASAKRCLVDSLACILVGSKEDSAQIVTAFVRELGGKASSTVIGAGVFTSPHLAALAMGTSAHASGYDDKYAGMFGHPTSGILPACLAIGEDTGASIREVLAAFIIGFEVAEKVGRALFPAHYQSGWDSTATVSAIGATMGACRLWKLDETQCTAAVGIAVSEAGGVRENIRSSVGALHAGRAALAGVVAAALARRGLSSSLHALDGEFGFASVLAGGLPAQLADLGGRLGNPYGVLDPGLEVKMYPCSLGIEPAVEAMLAVRHQYSLAPKDIDRIEVGVNRARATRILLQHLPSNAHEAKSSMQFCMAVTAIDGRLSLDDFRDDMLVRQDIRALMPRVSLTVAPDLEVLDEFHPGALLRVHLRSGETLVHIVEGPRGPLSRPVSDQAVLAKFGMCARAVLPGDAAAKAEELLRSADDSWMLKDLAAVLAGDPCPSTGNL